MDDDIQLPPLPPFGFAAIADEQTIRDYARAAVLADRERSAKVGAKPVMHKVRIVLKSNGGAWFPVGDDYIPVKGEIGVTLHWTADGRVWINSERNCYAAKMLRRYGYYNAADAVEHRREGIYANGYIS